MKRWLTGCVAIGLISLTGFSQKKQPIPEAWDKPFHHKLTDVILSTEIGGFRIVERVDYSPLDGDPGHFSVRYVDDTTKIDVYFSKPERPAKESDNPLQAHIDAVGGVVGGLPPVPPCGGGARERL